MMNALLISTAAYAISTFLCVAPVRAEDEEAVAFPSLPLPPEIVELIGLTDAKGHDVSVARVPLEPEPQTLMPDIRGVHAQDLVARVPRADEPLSVAAPFPLLPLPPGVGDLIGLRQTYPKGRNAHLALIRRQAERYRVPPELADAVAQIESAYNPQASGALGEVGLMQIRPETAALLGYRGTASGLFEPETNVYYSVAYLAGAWRRANGDLCRALMKYRAGHGEERMSAFSVEYCRRARSYLASTGSPLAEALLPPISAQASPSAGRPVTVAPNAQQVAAAAISAFSTPLPPRRLEPEKTRIASAGQVRVAAAQNSQLGEKASARVARRWPVCRKSGGCHAKRPANCSGGDFSLQRASTSASAGAGENEGRFGRSGETRGRTERATRRKGKRTRRSTRRFVCRKAGDCRAKRQAGCGGRHFGLQRASKSASARAGENERRFGRSGETRGRTERATQRKGTRTRRSTRRFVCRKAGHCRAKQQAGCGGRHSRYRRALASAPARAGENEGRFGRSGGAHGSAEKANRPARGAMKIHPSVPR